MDKAVKALIAAFGLVALVTALCFVSGFGTQLFLGEELEQSAQQAGKAANLIFERTQLKSTVNFSLKKSFTSGLTLSEVEVRFEYIPRRKQLSAKIEPNQLARFKFNQDELPDG